MTATQSFELGGGIDAARRARRALDGLDDRIEPLLYYDVQLLITELVTNSVRHSGIESGDNLTLTLNISPDLLRAEVHDGGAPFEPVAIIPAQAAGHGWGLVMVDRIADRWGVGGDVGKYVWFEIDRSAQS